MEDKLKFAIIGAGAMGSRFGAQLYEAGYEVTLYDVWEEHIRSIQKNGLIVKQDDKERCIHITAFTEPQQNIEYDVLMIFTKSNYTKSALFKYSSLITPKTYIVSLQNGLGNKELISQYVGLDRAIVGTTTYSSDLFAPGIIEIGGTGETLITHFNGTSSVVGEVEKALNNANIHTHVSPDAMRSIWEKLAFNAAINTTTAITKLTTGQVGNHPFGTEILKNIVEEVVVVAKYLDIEISVERVMNKLKKASLPDTAGNHYPSMYQDIIKKKRTEIEAINGAIIRESEKFQISVPYNRAVYGMIKMIEDYNLINQPV